MRGELKMKNCYVFGKLIFMRHFASSVSFSIHDGYRTTDFVVYENERNFKTGELRKNLLFETIVKLNLKEGCYVNIRGQAYSKEGTKIVFYRPYAITVVKPEDYEACKRLGFNI
jgi:hypothetical protein